MKRVALISIVFFASVQSLTISKVPTSRRTINRPLGVDRGNAHTACGDIAELDLKQNAIFDSTKSSSLVTSGTLAFLLASSLSLASLPAMAADLAPPTVLDATISLSQEEKSLGKQAGEWFFLAYVGFSTLAGVKGVFDKIQEKRNRKQ